MLLFRSEANVERWCEARQITKKPLMNLRQLWFLALQWYENRLTVDSRRPAADEMVSIFSSVGLTGPFWDPKSDSWQ